MTQSYKVQRDHNQILLEVGYLRSVSLGCGRPRFSIEVAYLREDHDFVFILFGTLDC